MKSTNRQDKQLRDTVQCRLEPVIRAMAKCPPGQRACMLWGLASRLCVVPSDERAFAFTCILNAIRQLPCIEQTEPLAELGLKIVDLPDGDRACALRAFVAAVGRMPVELQVGPLVELARHMIECAYVPVRAPYEGVPLLH